MNVKGQSIHHPNEYASLSVRLNRLSKEIRDVIKIFIDEIPQLPVHVTEILQIISNMDSDSKDIAKVAKSDPGMVSKILKAVNSAYFGLPKRTNDLHLAVTLLGFNEIRLIAIQSGVSKIFGAGWTYKDYNTKDLWEHSYLVSVCAETLVKAKNPKEAGTILTLGILHDIGKYALFRLAVLMKKKRIKQFFSGDISKQSNLLEKEKYLFGVDHTLVGNLLAQKWGFLENTCAVLGYHHHPSFYGFESLPPDYIKDITIICISDLIINRVINKNNILPEPAPEYFDILGYTSPLDTLITDELQESIEKARKFVSYIK